MKKLLVITGCIFMYLLPCTQTAEAQILKGFGKKLEKKIEQRIESKADRQVDKVLDKADKKTDEPIDDMLNKTNTKKQEKIIENQSSKNQSTSEAVVSRPEQALTLIGNNCTDFSWFKKGAVLEYEAFDENGKTEGTNRMEIMGLSAKGTATFAEVKASLTTPHFGNLDYEMHYICDGDRIYMDIGAMMKAMMQNNPELKNSEVETVMKDMDIDFNNDFASFPKKMFPGMELDDLNFSFKTKAGGSEMSFQTSVTDRQVVSREVVITPAGTFDCLKIRSITNTSIHVMGIKQTMPSSIEYLWISPKIGMIKQESYNGKEKATSMILKKYKL